MDIYRTLSHTRTFHFTNGPSIVLKGITDVRMENGDVIMITHSYRNKPVRTAIYRSKLDYFVMEDE